MKNLIITILTLAATLFTSCDSAKVEVLTDQDRATIESEVLMVLNQIVQNSEAVDLEKATAAYVDNPEFISINNGVVNDYKGFIKSNKEIFDVLEKQEYNETALMFTFIDKRNVILTYAGTAIATFKNKQQMKIDPFSATLFFRKFDDSWKVIYTNEFAAVDPIMEDSTIAN